MSGQAYCQWGARLGSRCWNNCIQIESRYRMQYVCVCINACKNDYQCIYRHSRPYRFVFFEECQICALESCQRSCVDSEDLQISHWITIIRWYMVYWTMPELLLATILGGEKSLRRAMSTRFLAERCASFHCGLRCAVWPRGHCRSLCQCRFASELPRLAVNVMAPFLLTSLLLENVRGSGAGWILAWVWFSPAM